jgi:hypothetical protein
MARRITQKLLEQLMQGTNPLQQNSLISDVYSGTNGINNAGGNVLERLLANVPSTGGPESLEKFIPQPGSLFSPSQLQGMEVPIGTMPKAPAVSLPGSGAQQLSLFDDVASAATSGNPLPMTGVSGPEISLFDDVVGATLGQQATSAGGPAAQAAKAVGKGGKTVKAATAKLVAAGKPAAKGIGKAAQGFMGNAGKLFNQINAATPMISTGLQVVDSGAALSDLATGSQDIRDLEQQILADSYGKGYQNLSMDEQRQIQQLRRGRKTTGDDFGGFLRGAGSGAGGAAITGALGLIPGMQWLLPLAAAQLATSGVKGITKEKQNQEMSLQNLYNKLQGTGY